MNKLTLERIAIPLLEACSKEGVTYKEAAKIFNTEPAYFKMLEREDKREAIPEKVMDRFHSWVYSGKKLKEYKMPENPNLPTSDPDIIPGPGEIVVGPFNSVAELTKAVNEHEKKARSKREPKAKFVYPHEKPKRKYTRKPKENPPEVTEKILADAPVPADKHYAEAAPDVRPDVRLDVPDIQIIPIEKAERVIKEWLRICPARLMIPKDDIAIIANSVGVDRLFAKEVIIREIANDDLTRTCKHPYFTRKSEESETDLLKSEIKTLSFLLAREHEANEVLRAENGYLNARINYKVNRATDIIRELNKENNALRDKVKSTDAIDWRLGYKIGDIIEKVRDATYDRLRKENNELEDQIRKYLRRGFWARVFNRPVK